MSRWLRILAASFVVMTTAGHAAAQQPSLSDRETARSLMDDGDKKRDGGDLKGALKSYEAADAIMKVPTTGLDVARTQAALGMLLEARETLARVMRTAPKPTDPPPFAAARKAADTLNEELSARIPSIHVVIVGNEQPPQVSVDGEPVPAAAAAMARKVNPGKHVIVVKAGSSEQRHEVTVAERETKTVNVDMKAPPPTPPTTTKPAHEEPPATASVDSISTPKILMYAGFGVAVVGVGVGSVTGIMSISKTGDLKDVCPNDRCPSKERDALDSATLLGNVSTIAFIAGGVGVGVGVVGLLMSRGEKREAARAPSRFATVNATPVIGPSYAGIRGTF